MAGRVPSAQRGAGLPEAVLDGLERIVGRERLLTTVAERRAYARDSWPLAALKVLHGADLELPDAVVLPGSTAEVAAVVSLLYEHGVPVIPFGGGSGVLGGTTPVAGGVVLDLKRLDRVLAVDGASLTVTAQAGVLAVDLEATLGRQGLTLGHFPQSIDVATLGGLIATRSAGQFSTKYGNIEDLVLGLEVVLPEGRVIRTKVAARSSTGPDLKNLFVGSEGTLGIITEATLRVRPRPEKRVGRAYELERFHDGLEVVRRVLRTGLAPAVVRLYDPVEAQHSFREWVEQGRSLLVLVCEGLGRLVDLEVQVVEETLADFPHRALGPAPAEHWLERRNVVAALPEFMSQRLVVDTLEISTTWDRVGALYDAALARMLAVRGVVAATAHSSHAYTHGTNLYLTFVALGPDLAEAERVYQEAWHAAMSACLEVGGTIGHHHGVGLQRRPWMAAEHGEALEVLCRLKVALDPKGLMNPGKLLPRPDTGARGDGKGGLR